MAYAQVAENIELSTKYQEVLYKFNNGQSESIQFCTNLLKINKRNKKQERLFILTDKAIYSLKRKKIQRRVLLRDIALITKSSVSPEFTLTIPSQYDYRFTANDKTLRDKVISAISQQMMAIDHDVIINTIDDESTAQWTVTKNDVKGLNAHHDETVRTVFALDHLQNMGFNKSKMVRKSYKANKQNVSETIVSLLEHYVEQLENNDERDRSPFTNRSKAPLVIKLSCKSPSMTPSVPNVLSPSQSFTAVVDDGFAL